MRIGMGHIHGVGQVTMISEGQSCPPGTYSTQQPTGNQPGICMESFCYPLPGVPCPGGSTLPPASGPDTDNVATWDSTGPLTVTTLAPPVPKPAPAVTAPASPTLTQSQVASPASATLPVTQSQIAAATSTPAVPLGPVAVASASSTDYITEIENWLTETSIDSIPNWVLLAGGAALLFFLGRHRR